VPPNAQYIFKHALVQDVAYASLLRANRQQVHARIARAYETRFPEVVRAQPELVALHFTEAGLSDAAIEYWQRAGDLAMARSGHAEAIHHFSVALDLLTKLGERPDFAAKELELCVKLGPALVMMKGTSPEVEAIYRRAVALKVNEDSSARFKALWGLYYCSLASRRFIAANWPLQTSILKKASHDMTARSIIPSRSPSVAMILARALTAPGRSTWRFWVSPNRQ
jgi:hypothetical protein